MQIWGDTVQPMTGFNCPPYCGPCTGPASLITHPLPPSYSRLLSTSTGTALLPGPVRHPQPEGGGCPHTACGQQGPVPGFFMDLSTSAHSDPRSSCCSLRALRGPARWAQTEPSLPGPLALPAPQSHQSPQERGKSEQLHS